MFFFSIFLSIFVLKKLRDQSNRSAYKIHFNLSFSMKCNSSCWWEHFSFSDVFCWSRAKAFYSVKFTKWLGVLCTHCSVDLLNVHLVWLIVGFGHVLGILFFIPPFFSVLVRMLHFIFTISWLLLVCDVAHEVVLSLWCAVVLTFVYLIGDV